MEIDRRVDINSETIEALYNNLCIWYSLRPTPFGSVSESPYM
jgi:hypothetical protein